MNKTFLTKQLQTGTISFINFALKNHVEGKIRRSDDDIIEVVKAYLLKEKTKGELHHPNF